MTDDATLDLILQRRGAQSADCTQGFLRLPDVVLATLELPWIADPDFPGGAPDRSCVPPGLYTLALHDTPKHPKTFALVNRALGVIHEPDATFPNARVACLIHAANYPHELEGCIGLGTVADTCVVWSSQIALAKFKLAVPWVEGHTLTIVAQQEIST